MKPILRLILGDQLNIEHSWFREPVERATFVMMEVKDEARYVTHHIQKIAAFFLAMRAFRDALLAKGYSVIYLDLDAPSNRHALDENIEALLANKGFSQFEYQAPDEYRVQQLLSQLCERIAATHSIPSRACSTEHFLTDQEFFKGVYKGHKRYVMESFYRAVRRSHDIFMDGEEPIGGAWNFDSENRNKLPATITPPPPLTFPRDISEITSLLTKHGIPSLGSAPHNHITWPLTREESLQTLDYFCMHLLEHFGSFQDAMHTEHRFLFHSRLSFALNVKLLSPKEVIDRAIAEWRKRPAAISVPQIEGFIRQIAGWREFIRGVYWAHMPQYKQLNFFDAQRPLPHFYWDADTKMNCLHHAIKQSLEESYAHHIQRLMITGNFALIAGLNPDQVDAWYLGIYADAIEWVQLPNTRGMSQCADGGIVGTKPYSASANYINKMSNYCSGCFYNYKDRTGDRACPFNSLYWDFLMRNQKKLEKNPRIGMAYRTLAKMSATERAEITDKAQSIFNSLENL